MKPLIDWEYVVGAIFATIVLGIWWGWSDVLWVWVGFAALAVLLGLIVLLIELGKGIREIRRESKFGPR